MSKKRNRSTASTIYDSDYSNLALNAREELCNGEKTNEVDTDDDDRFMPMQQSTNPITTTGSSTITNNNYKSNDSDDDDEQHPSLTLRGLRSLGGCMDVEVLSSIKKKKKSSAASSVLVIVPGHLQQQLTNDMTDSNKLKSNQGDPLVKIGRIEGFHNFDATSPNNNHLKLSLGGSSCRGKNSSTSSTATHTSISTTTNATTTTKLDGRDMTESSSDPTILFHGRSIPTTTTFVVLRITTSGGSSHTTPTKKQTKGKQKVTCTGVYNNVIVFGKGNVITEKATSAQQSSSTAATPDACNNATLESQRRHHPKSDLLPVTMSTVISTTEAKPGVPTIDPVTSKAPQSPKQTKTITKSYLLSSTPTELVCNESVQELAVNEIRSSVLQEQQQRPPRSGKSKDNKQQQSPSDMELETNSTVSNIGVVMNASESVGAATIVEGTPYTNRTKRSRRISQQHSGLKSTTSTENNSLLIEKDAEQMTATTMQSHELTTSSPAVAGSILARKVIPASMKTMASPRSQTPTKVVTTTTGSCDNSIRKRRRNRNIDTTKSPSSVKKLPYSAVNDSDDDEDEFAFLGG